MESSFRGSGEYVASEELLQVTNIAIALQKPLLIKGEPGTGKTGPGTGRSGVSAKAAADLEHQVYHKGSGGALRL